MSLFNLNDAPRQGVELNIDLSGVEYRIPYEENDDFPDYPNGSIVQQTQPVQQPVPPTQPVQQAQQTQPTQQAQQGQPTRPKNSIEDRLQGLDKIGRYKELQKISDEDLEPYLYLLQEKYNLENECCFASSFQGRPAPQEQYLVDGTFSMAKGHLFAADGGLGKGMLLLELAVNVASEKTPLLVTFCGRSILQYNKKAVIIAGEDSMDDFHRRIESMELPKPENLRLVAMPNKAGGSSLFYRESNGRYKIATLWKVLANQICEMKPALVVIDPLSALIEIDSDTDNNGVSFVTKHIATLASESGACIIVSSHVRKSTAKVGERATIKGTVALINGLRSASILWEADSTEAGKICKQIGEDYEQEKILYFQSVKNNSAYNKRREVLKRMKDGRLICITDYWKNGCTPERAEELLIDRIKQAAENSQPFKATGEDGLYKQRGDLPDPLNTWSKNRLTALCNKLLEEGKIVKGSQDGGKSKCWLDVPDGPVACGKFKAVKPGARIYGDCDGIASLTDDNDAREFIATAEAAAEAETEPGTDSNAD